MSLRLTSALLFASEKHSQQKRKNKNEDPYINHPIRILNILALCDVKDEDTLIARILHDTIEDVGVTKDEIEKLFNENVANIITECSDNKSLSKVKRKQLQIEHVKSISDSAKLVKLADKYSNLSGLIVGPPISWFKEIVYGYACWSYLVCREMKSINEKLNEMLNKFFLNSMKCLKKICNKY